jgi:hypothetical protein
MTPARQPQQEYIITEGELKKLMSWSTHKSPGVCQYERRLEILKVVEARPHTSPPAPARSGCDGCRKEIEHLECPTPGHCDQMKCSFCCEGSDFPTLPEEIKKYEQAAAKAEREQVMDKIHDMCECVPSKDNDRDFDKGFHQAMTLVRGWCKSLRAQQEQP